MITRRACYLGLIALALTGCWEKKDGSISCAKRPPRNYQPEAGPQTWLDPDATPRAPALPAPAALVPGAEPRRAVRYAAVDGARRRYRLAFSHAVTAGSGAQQTETSFVGELVLAGRVAVAGAQARSVAEVVETTIREAKAEPLSRDRVAEAWAKLRGAALAFAVDERGTVTGADDVIEPPALTGAPPSGSFAEILRELALIAQLGQVRWPAEPIGVGARWEVDRRVRRPVGGDGGELVTRYRVRWELVALAADRATVRFTIDEDLPRDEHGGRPRFPSADPAVRMEADAHQGHAEGELQIDLREPLATGLTVTRTARTSLLTSAAGAETIELGERTTLTLSSPP